MTLDKGAANRFIKHAIASIATQRPPGQDEGMSREQLGEGSSKDIPIKMTSKMIARAQYEKELKEAGSEEEDELEVFDEGNDDMEVDGDRGDTSDKGKGKGRASDIDCGAEGVRKRRRVAMDPFDGLWISVQPGCISAHFTFLSQVTRTKFLQHRLKTPHLKIAQRQMYVRR